MKRVLQAIVVAVVAAQALLIGQGGDVARVLADVREALGGEAKLSAVRLVQVEGQRTRVVSEGQSRASAFEFAMGLPDKFVRTDVMGNFNGMDIMRTSGFNGPGLIEKTDAPQMGGGGHVMMRIGPGGMVGGEATPEQLEAQRQMAMASNKREFARLALGMFGQGFAVFPLEFAYAGTAESPDGSAHVLDVRGEDDFQARMFIDTKSHLPLMLSWMDKEPLTMNMGGGPQVIQRSGSGASSAQIRREMEDKMREAEANRKVVEYRIFYTDYKAFDGVKFPTRIQRMIDGNPLEELSFDKVRINGKLDAKLFEITK
jgi:hypothetical protein